MISIRQEQEADFATVDLLIEKAFRTLEISDHREHILVQGLREWEGYIPELSLVAESESRVIVGHILLSPIQIRDEDREFQSLVLAPVAVAQSHQRQGIGGKLIRAAHHKALQLDFSSVVLIGHADYYPRFGYSSARNFGIRFPFEVSDKNGLAIALRPGALDNVHGVIQFPPPFLSLT